MCNYELWGHFFQNLVETFCNLDCHWFELWTYPKKEGELLLNDEQLAIHLASWEMFSMCYCELWVHFFWNFMEMFHKINNCQSWEGEAQHDHDDEQLVIHWFPIHSWAFPNWRVKFSTHLKTFYTLRLDTKEKGFNERLNFYRKLRMGVQIWGETKNVF
jgi:hypothetical protein